MRSFARAFSFVLAAVLGPLGCLTFAAGEPAAPKKEAFKPLFNGRDLTGWYTFLEKHGKNSDPDHVIAIEDGAIHFYKDALEGSTVVMGYVATEKEYGDFHLRVQYRWEAKKFQPRYTMKRDAGLYYHIIGPDHVWPQSLEYQVQQTDVGDFLALFGVQAESWIDPATRNDPEAPTYLSPERGGQPRLVAGRDYSYQKHLAGDFEQPGWNTIEVIARGDTTVHLLNGHEVNRAKNIRFIEPGTKGPARTVTKGKIALELEAAEISFRNVEIRSLEDEK
jgi:hypothetical protein